MDNQMQNRIVDGYVFLNAEDAKVAQQEKKKVEYLEKHMDYTNPENVRMLYQSAIDDKLFCTPIGYSYLRVLQTSLYRCGKYKSEEIPALPLRQTYYHKIYSEYGKRTQRIKPSKKEKMKWPLFSLIANLILLIAIILMFTITIKSENPNIINYKTNLINKYSEWEQTLIEREKVIREKEKELRIDGQ